MDDLYTTNYSNEQHSTHSPHIKSFALPNVSIKTDDNNKKHTCSITFDAPHEVNEHEMMDYIMGIEEALGAKVVKFSWSMSEGKK